MNMYRILSRDMALVPKDLLFLLIMLHPFLLACWVGGVFSGTGGKAVVQIGGTDGGHFVFTGGL